MMYLFNSLSRDEFEPVWVVLRSNRIFFEQSMNSAKSYILRDEKQSYFACVLKFRRIIKSEEPHVILSFNPRSNRLVYLATLFTHGIRHIASVRNTNQRPWLLLSEFIFRSRPVKVVVNSVGTKSELMKKARIKAKKIEVIPNGLDIDYFRPYDAAEIKTLRKSLDIEDDTFVVLSVGRVHNQKNLFCILEAIRLFVTERETPKILYLNVGLRQNKKLYQGLQAFIKKHNLGEVCDFLDESHEIVNYYNLADVTVLASLWEGLPNVVLESMATRKIAIVADSADNDEVVTHGVNGFKFRTNDSCDLYHRLRDVLELSVEERESIGSAARESVTKRFGMSRMVTDFKKVLIGDSNS